MNSGGLLPKTGSLQAEWRRCGKGGRQRRRYVPGEQVNAMRAAIAQRRRLRPPAWSLRQELAELRQLAQDIPRHETQMGINAQMAWGSGNRTGFPRAGA